MKSVGFVRLSLKSLATTVPLFVIFNVVSEVSFTSTLPKFICLLEKVMALIIAVPVRLIVSGLLFALLLNINFPVLIPDERG